jgi:hypothetical protein
MAITIDANGNIIKNYDLNLTITAYGSVFAVSTPDKGFIFTGGRQGDIATNMVLAKYDANLNKQWENNFNSTAGGSTGFSVYPLHNGGYAVAVYTRAFGNGLNGSETVLYKTDANGKVH